MHTAIIIIVDIFLLKSQKWIRRGKWMDGWMNGEMAKEHFFVQNLICVAQNVLYRQNTIFFRCRRRPFLSN